MATKSLHTTQPDSPANRRAAGWTRGRGRIVLLVLGVFLLLGAGAIFLQWQDAISRVPQGVEVAGLPVAGLKTGEAEAAIEQHFAGMADSQVVLRYNAQVWTFTARDLGLSFDAAATAHAAQQAGRNAAPPAIPLVVTRDRAAAEHALQIVAGDVAVPPRDATLNVDADSVRVGAAQSGRRLDLDATWQALEAATQNYPFSEITVKVAEVLPQVADSAVAPALATVHRLSDKPLTLTGAGPDGKVLSWTVPPSTLRTWLQISADAKGAPVAADKLDAAKMSAYLQGLAGDLKRAPKDAAIALPNYATSANLTPDVAGQQLNVAASLPLVQAAAAGDSRSAELVLDPVPAAVNAAMLQPLKDQLDAAMTNGLTLSGGGKTYQVSGRRLALILYVEQSPAGSPLPYQITVNDRDLARLAAQVADDVDVPAQNATYRLVNNKVTLVRQPADGIRVDQAKTGAAIRDAVLNGKATADLTLLTVKPQFAATDLVDQILTPDLLQADSTYYGGSSPERNWNVTLGAQKLDGWLIPPGGVFSTNDALGELTLDAGFKMGWAILVQAGNATTIPSEAGGICQVATTLFHPVFWAGLPIVERHHHSYWIASYGLKPLGMQGLDATISPPDSDFRFKNTTGNWLLIRAIGDHQNVRVELWGTNPGWRVKVDQPVITNVVRTDRTPRQQTSDKLPAGRKVMVEHAQDGFTSDIHRQVFDKSGAKIDDWHAQGTYLPSHDTYVTGTGPASPAP
jgi:vancomycin resistance protein YoaR